MMASKDIKIIAERVISEEANALNKMSKRLPDDFADAVAAISQIKGRVIVSGVGKSGHIGAKIAATFASTGTPANFVHATEASHGDLGMVTQNDFCLLISNSGETSELRDIVSHSKRFGIPMAAISSKLDSTLMEASDYKLNIPELPEACALGMAPTTSTILSLALGDALAVALMELRDFQSENFHVLHPGGKLGVQMLKVGTLMRSVDEMAILEVGTPIKEVILKMTETGFGVAVLVDHEGLVVGVITDGDLRRNAANLLDLNASEIATRDPISVNPSELIPAAVAKMELHKVYTLLVLEENKPVGVLRMHDILRAGYSQ